MKRLRETFETREEEEEDVEELMCNGAQVLRFLCKVAGGESSSGGSGGESIESKQ